MQAPREVVNKLKELAEWFDSTKTPYVSFKGTAPGYILESIAEELQKVFDREPEPGHVTLGSLGQGMTPNDLEILIHFYTSPAPHPRCDALSFIENCNRMVGYGIIQRNPGDHYSITQKGKAWMRCILDTPFPCKVWLDGNGHIIDINED